MKGLWAKLSIINSISLFAELYHLCYNEEDILENELDIIRNITAIESQLKRIREELCIQIKNKSDKNGKDN